MLKLRKEKNWFSVTICDYISFVVLCVLLILLLFPFFCIERFFL